VAANGSFAISRPVRQNFLIVKGQEGLAGIEIRADPDGTGGCRARSGWLGPAVLTDLQSYRLRDVNIEPTNPPLGASPGKMRFSLLPYYKSGFVLKVGKVARLIAVGRLVNTQQEPIPHMLVEIQSVDHREDKLISTFTSRNGGFQMPDVRPGRYEIRPPSSTIWGSVIVEIKELPTNLYRLGDIVVVSKPSVNTIVAKRGKFTGNRDTDSSSIPVAPAESPR
jgi:outer membrane usher protein